MSQIRTEINGNRVQDATKRHKKTPSAIKEAIIQKHLIALPARMLPTLGVSNAATIHGKSTKDTV